MKPWRRFINPLSREAYWFWLYPTAPRGTLNITNHFGPPMTCPATAGTTTNKPSRFLYAKQALNYLKRKTCIGMLFIYRCFPNNIKMLKRRGLKHFIKACTQILRAGELQTPHHSLFFFKSQNKAI